METDVPLNQSEFYQETKQFQPPPETVKPPPSNEDIQKQKRLRRTIIFITIGGLLFIILLIALIALKPPIESPPPPPTPTPQVTKAPSTLQQELKHVDEAVTQADPHAPYLEPPPVEMNVDF